MTPSCRERAQWLLSTIHLYCIECVCGHFTLYEPFIRSATLTFDLRMTQMLLQIFTTARSWNKLYSSSKINPTVFHGTLLRYLRIFCMKLCCSDNLDDDDVLSHSLRYFLLCKSSAWMGCNMLLLGGRSLWQKSTQAQLIHTTYISLIWLGV